MPQAKVKKAQFIRSFTEAGLTYAQAEQAYAAMLKTFENGVARHQSIIVGHIGALHVRQLMPRRVVMGCHKDASAGNREYLVGTRKRYRFNLFKSVGQRFGLVP
jgi:hypothetical protein